MIDLAILALVIAAYALWRMRRPPRPFSPPPPGPGQVFYPETWVRDDDDQAA